MNLIQPTLNAFSPQSWGALAGALNESPDRTRQGLADALPMLFASLIGKGSTPGGAAGLLAMMRNSPLDLDRLFGSPNPTQEVLREGDALAHNVLGDSFNTAAGAISRHAGVALSSAQSLLGLAAPLALGGIKRNAPPSGFTPEGLMRFLQGQRDDVLAAAPQGLPLNLPERTVSAAPRTAAQPTSRRGGALPWLLGIAAALLLALIVGQCMSARTPAPAKLEPLPAPQVTAPTLPTIQLPGGIQLNAAPGSIGYNLAEYLGSAQPAPQTFTFDNLNFDTGNIVVTPESRRTLDAIATTLNAYPNAQVRLEGHTDNVGDRQANIDLSLARAQAVAASLSERGVDPARVTTAGFGPDNPVGSNDTEAGRAQNRRLELTVTQK